MTTIPFDSLTTHPDAVLKIDFGDYANYAALVTALNGDGWTGVFDAAAANPGATDVDSTTPFNARNTLRYDNYTGTYANHDIDPTKRLWYRLWFYFDPAGDSEDSEDRFPNDILVFDRGVESNDSPLDSWKGSIYMPDLFFSIDTLYDQQSSALSGRWIPLIVLQENTYDAESDAYSQRLRVWSESGSKIFDFNDSDYDPTAGSGEITSVNCFLENSGGGGDLPKTRVAFLEYLTTTCPYSGLEDYEGCGTPQWGGVTGYTHYLGGGTMRTNVELGGQPKGGYKRWRPLGTTKTIKPNTPPRPEPPVPGGVTSTALTETVTIGASGSTDTTILLPADSQILAVSALVITAIPGPTTSFSVGDSGDATRFSTANVSTAAGSSDPGTKAGNYYNATATPVRLTMNGGSPGASTGRVRVTISVFRVSFAS